MKKKISILLSIVMCMLAFVACGGIESYDELTRNTQIQSSMQGMTSQLCELDAETAVTYATYYASVEDGEIYANMFTQWASVANEAGDFVEFTDFEVTESGDTLTAVQTAEFTNRDVTLTYVMDADTLEVTAVNTAVVYTLGETMGKALLNTVMGILIVFCVLVLISLVIYCFKFIPKITNWFNGLRNKNQETEGSVTTPVVTSVKATTDTVDETDNLELVAVITAAIAASTGASTDSFVVRSIKRR